MTENSDVRTEELANWKPVRRTDAEAECSADCAEDGENSGCCDCCG